MSNPGNGVMGAAAVRLRWEIVLVLGASLGLSAISSLLSLLRSVLAETPISEQTTQLNPTRDALPVWDVVYAVLNVAGDLFLVGLVLYLLWEPGRSAFRAIGLDFTRFPSDLLRAFLIGLAIGIPGLGLYVLGRILELSITVVAAPGTPPWWTIAVLVLSAVRAGLLEEVIMLGWLGDRLQRLGVGPWAIIVAAATVRGLYHAYQGIPGIAGNFLMGLVFGWLYRRWGRVMPLVLAHTLIDIVAFVGYPFAVALFPALFGPPT